MDPREALSRIEQIREQLARAELVRAFRAASVASTGIIAFVAAMVQWRWNLNDCDNFLNLWLLAAAAGIVVVGTEMAVRCACSGSTLQRDATLLAVRQFVPCVVAGALLTLALYQFAPDALRLLPGLWGIIFSLGVFASRPGLPRAANLVGGYYMLAGLFVIAAAPNQAQFEVWPMPLVFGVGQLMAAGVLYFSYERRHGLK
jgi:hypothetical protein